MRFPFFLAALLGAGSMLAQEAPRFPSPPYFRHTFQTPRTRIELQPPARLEDFLVDGGLELSLRNYLELVMANNTDIAIQKLSLEMPRNNIIRAFGTFDPAFVGSFSANRAKDASTSSLAGASVLNQLSQIADFRYTQTLQNGTLFNVGFNWGKSSSNNSFSTFNPAHSTQLAFGLTQPLLRNRGAYITRLPIMVARSTLRKSEYDLRDQLLQLVQSAESAYWDVIESRESLKVQEEYLKLNDVSLKRSQRELELGALSPLDIYRPQQQYAQAEIQVSRYRFQLAQREDVLRRLIGADLDPRMRKLPVVLTETVLPPVNEAAVDPEAAVQKALAMRPDLRSAQQSLDLDELSIKSSTNALRPDLSLTAGYTSKGRGGTYYDKTDPFGDGNLVSRIVPGGFGDSLSQLFAFEIPTYAFGLTLRFPIRDRRASADLANSLVQKRLDALRVRSTEQRVRLDVLNAINNVEAAKAGVRLAKVAVDFAKKQADAEQKKYDLGTNIMYFVLQAQTDLASAESELVTQSIEYRKSLLNLLRYTGELLDERGVAIK